MKKVFIIGIGATPVGEHYPRSLVDLALESMREALKNSPFSPQDIGALYVANALGETLAGQAQLGAGLASAAGLQGIEALRVEAAGASGGVALRQGLQAIQSGAYDLVMVTGVEKATDKFDTAIEAGQALALDSDSEAELGLTLTSQWAMLMRRYMHEYGYTVEAFAPFPVNAHANGAKNPGALYRFPIKADKYCSASQIASPLNMFDCSTLADGAATVILASESLAHELGGKKVQIAGSAVATTTLALNQRQDLLWLTAAQQSASKALKQAHLKLTDINVLDITDPHSITAALVLEACGFVERGKAPSYAAEGGISLSGPTPLATAGGYKSRGDVGGATGVYQVVEVVRQLWGEAGATQVQGAKVGFIQCLGGVGTTAVTHLLVAS